MPSVLLTQASGHPFPLISGNAWSGQGAAQPYSMVRLHLDRSASGNAYVSLSGNASGLPPVTINSGGFLLSGRNCDMMVIAPGQTVEYPRLGFVSGQCNLFVACEAAASGQARLYWEKF
jgi:hypothetical protein